jgi:large subunit ribosomal protein L3
MVRGLWGKKIGMTQVFSADNRVIPVTVIDLADWLITQVKTKEKDGYSAVQVGCLRKRYNEQEFSSDWLKNPKKFFLAFKEIALSAEDAQFNVGEPADVRLLNAGDVVDVFGITFGRGFQGAMKRHGFAGGPASHGGQKFGRRPGSLSFMRRQGRVIKGKRLPGQMGLDRQVMRNLEVVRMEPESKVLLVKGSVPGKSGSFVFVRKRK